MSIIEKFNPQQANYNQDKGVKLSYNNISELHSMSLSKLWPSSSAILGSDLNMILILLAGYIFWYKYNFAFYVIISFYELVTFFFSIKYG